MLRQQHSHDKRSETVICLNRSDCTSDGRRIVDIISDVNMAYSEHARRYLADCGLPKERTYVAGSQE